VRSRTILAFALSVGLHGVLAFLLFNGNPSTSRKTSQLPLKVVRKQKQVSPQEVLPEVKPTNPGVQQFQTSDDMKPLKGAGKEVRKHTKTQPKVVEERPSKDSEKPPSGFVTKERTFHSFGIRLENTPHSHEGQGIPVQKGETLKTHQDGQRQEERKDTRSESAAVALGTVTTMPRLLVDSKPEYPEEARKRGVEGKVILEIIVDEKGEVASARVLKSVEPVLDKVALDAAKKLRFSPATKDGRPVSVKITYTFAFVLE